MSHIRENNLLMNRMDYDRRNLILESLPTVLIVELTQNCNLSCKMCRSAHGYDKSLDMRPELFDRLAKDLFPYAQMVDLRGWGESTILKNFENYLRITLDSGVKVRLVTNAHAMTGKLWDMFFEGDNIVGVSFDSSSPEVFKKLGRGDYQKVVANIRHGVSIRDERGRGEIYLLVVVSRHTLPDLPNIVRLAGDLGVRKVIVNPIKVSNDSFANLRYVADQIPSVLNEAARQAKSLGVKLQVGSSLDQSLTVNYGLPSVCGNPWSHALIDYAGRVGFCDHLINHPECTLGSLGENSFESIWNGRPFQDLRAQHILAEAERALDDRFWKCTWCYNNRYQDAEKSPVEGDNKREVSSATGLPLYKISTSRVGTHERK
jgi:MoaA/NifB/PqqE/SkfB family radical SAM enzyme